MGGRSFLQCRGVYIRYAWQVYGHCFCETKERSRAVVAPSRRNFRVARDRHYLGATRIKCYKYPSGWLFRRQKKHKERATYGSISKGLKLASSARMHAMMRLFCFVYSFLFFLRGQLRIQNCSQGGDYLVLFFRYALFRHFVLGEPSFSLLSLNSKLGVKDGLCFFFLLDITA